MEQLHQDIPKEGSVTAGLVRLQKRQAALLLKSDQLAARAQHLSRVLDAANQRSQRRRDAHDKIVLGALMMMTGLQRFQIGPNGEPIVVDTMPKQPSIVDEPIPFDKDLLIGALLTLSRQLNGNKTTTIEQRHAMRAEGTAFRKLSKSRRRQLLFHVDASSVTLQSE